MAAAVVAVAAIAGVVGASASNGTKPPRLQFLGQAIVPTGTTFAGTTVGGLSSITYDQSRGVFYSLSDDQGTFNPARFYTLRIDVSDGHLDAGDVSFTGVTTLRAPGGAPYAPSSLDPEGLTLAKGDELIVTSEGIAANGIAPWVRRYALDGTFRGDLPVPAAFLPTSSTHGVRQNLAFEAAAVAPQRPPSVRRHGGRAGAGRPDGDGREREHVSHPPLQPVVGTPRPAGRLPR